MISNDDASPSAITLKTLKSVSKILMHPIDDCIYQSTIRKTSAQSCYIVYEFRRIVKIGGLQCTALRESAHYVGFVEEGSKK